MESNNHCELAKYVHRVWVVVGFLTQSMHLFHKIHLIRKDSVNWTAQADHIPPTSGGCGHLN